MGKSRKGGAGECWPYCWCCGGRPRQGSMAVGSGSTATGTPMSSTTTTATATAGSVNAGQGVEVRLLDCRAVVVRTNIPSSGSNSNSRSDLQGRKSTAVNAEGVGDAESAEEGGMSVSEETMKRNKEDAEFWEKAKRRVGFEVAEFLRR